VILPAETSSISSAAPTGTAAGGKPLADRLDTDLGTLETRLRTIEITPKAVALGAGELIEEVSKGKITGEEDRYSHTDLWDFAANVEGSKAAIDALRPALAERDPRLLRELDTQFAKVAKVLDKHRKGTGFKLHTELSKGELRELSDAINALGEPVSKVAAAIATK